MSEEQLPEGQLDASTQQGLQQRDWEASFKGLQPKYQASLSEVSRLSQENASLSSQVEQLRLQLNQAGQAKDLLSSDLGTKLTEAQTQITTLQAELTPLKQLQEKITFASQKGFTRDLLPVIEHIPYSPDQQVMESTLSAFQSTVDARIKAREAQLLSGTTAPVNAVNTSIALPTSTEAWQKYVNEPGITRPEKDKRFGQWREWGASQG